MIVIFILFIVFYYFSHLIPKLIDKRYSSDTNIKTIKQLIQRVLINFKAFFQGVFTY